MFSNFKNYNFNNQPSHNISSRKFKYDCLVTILSSFKTCLDFLGQHRRTEYKTLKARIGRGITYTYEFQ